MGDSITRTHNLAAIGLVIDGIPVSDLSPDGGFTCEAEEDLFENSVGADGISVSSRTNNDDVMCEISVSQYSRAYYLLAERMQAQLDNVAAGIGIQPLETSMVNPFSGESITGAYTTFMSRPMPTQEKGPTDRVFKLKLTKPQYDHGSLNV